MCVDYTDLNKACPKDPFPLPNIDYLVDSTAGYPYLTFMDAFSGYNQIMMCPDDEEKTSFVTDQGLYCYKVMPFGLKNAGATFQRMINKVFDQQLGRGMEAYVDDMLVKGIDEAEHLVNLREAFQTMDKVGMRLNPKKSFFCLTGGKFLGYIVSARGIEVNPTKSQAIIDMPPPKTPKEVQTLAGRIVALSRFIAKTGETCYPFFQSFRKGKLFEWNEQCQQAFDKLKEYLTNPPRMSRPEKGETLYLYLAAGERAISSVLVREVEDKQQPVYFVSRILRDAETRYTPLEKAAFALVISARKLRPYFQSYTVCCRTNLPLQKVLGQLDVSGRLLKWAVELSEFDLHFSTRPAMKSQVLADFIAEYTGPLPLEEAVDKPWTVHVDGASSTRGAGAGVTMVTPRGEKSNYAIQLLFAASNNVAEYEALIAGLTIATGAGARKVVVHSDSQLAVKQFNGEFEAKDATLLQYKRKVKELCDTFEEVQIMYVPRTQNTTADALSKLAANGALENNRPVSIYEVPLPSILDKPQAKESLVIGEAEEWYSPILRYLTKQELPADAVEKRRIRRMSPLYTVIDGDLYKKGFTFPWLKCLGKAKADEMLREVHEGICGSHQGAKTLAHRIMRAGYYWRTIRGDAHALVQRCPKCQYHSKKSHKPPSAMKSIVSPWPFDLWGIDILGPFTPAKRQLKFIIVAVDYFTKWVEAEAVATITSARVVNFVWRNIVCRFGLPRAMIMDNGTQFASAEFSGFCEGLKIEQQFASVHHPQSNGQTEVANRTILEGLKRKIENAKTEWPDLLDEILWAYRTTPRSGTKESPYLLAFGTEAVTPMELVEPSPRIQHFSAEANEEARRAELDVVEEVRNGAAFRLREYHRRVRKAFDKKVSPRRFQPGDLVLRRIEATGKKVDKLDPSWEGPYRVVHSFQNGAYRLETSQGEAIPRTWNAEHLRKFYV